LSRGEERSWRRLRLGIETAEDVAGDLLNPTGGALGGKLDGTLPRQELLHHERILVSGVWSVWFI
jgi:hypothetical protein